MKEEEIRKKKTFVKLLEHTKYDAKYFFKKKFEKIKCYSCNKSLVKKFIKTGFQYSECPICNGLFVNPRPSLDEIARFYVDSKTAKYYSKFYKSNQKARQKKLWEPKAKLIKDFLKKEKIKKANIIDLGAGYGQFCKIFKNNRNLNVYGIEPSKLMCQRLRKIGIKCINKFAEDLEKEELPKGRNIFVSFELFEHLQNPSRFLKHLAKVSKKGDYFIFTTLSGTGIDIRDLWENSNAISPPQHLNFFNPFSIKIFLEKNNFKICKLITPGVLDVSILENNFELIKSNFLKMFLKYSTQNEKNNFQNFLISSKNSSHLMVFSKINI